MHFSLSDCILDLVQNSIEAGSAVIGVTLNQSSDELAVHIGDDGCGMTEDELKRATDPFYTDGKKHKHRKVGLGLPFLIQTVSMTGGRFDIDSKKGKGTELDIAFNLNNIDTPPIGDLVSMLYQIMSFNGDYNLTVNRSYAGKEGKESYSLNRMEMLEVLGDLESVSSLGLLKEYICSSEDDLIKGPSL